MKILGPKEEQAITVEPIINVVCNKCDKSILDSRIDYICSGTEISVSFGYGSRFDGLKQKFDLCDDCYEDIILSFKHTPDNE